jgi:hypothetical protein
MHATSLQHSLINHHHHTPPPLQTPVCGAIIRAARGCNRSRQARGAVARPKGLLTRGNSEGQHHLSWYFSIAKLAIQSFLFQPAFSLSHLSVTSHCNHPPPLTCADPLIHTFPTTPAFLSTDVPVCPHLPLVITKTLRKRRGLQISAALHFDTSSVHIAGSW